MLLVSRFLDGEICRGEAIGMGGIQGRKRRTILDVGLCLCLRRVRLLGIDIAWSGWVAYRRKVKVDTRDSAL